MTREEERLALRKMRIAASPAFLQGGFRPFFLGGAAWAIAALALWLAALLGGLALPTALDPLAWHRHEMLFGFVGAIVAGFLLTAIPNWTGRPPIAGGRLAALFALWLAGRLVLLASAVTGLVPALLFDAGFYIVLGLVAAREVIAAKNRNFPLAALVLLIGLADALDYLGFWAIVEPEIGARAGIALITAMITLIGGRIIPSFTRNWLMKRGGTGQLPTEPGRFDHLAVGLTGIALLLWVVAPGAAVTGAALVLAGLANLMRLARWRGVQTWRDPLVLILHIGYAWAPAGLLLLAGSILGTAVPRTAAIHALTAGAMGTMILAVMTRATLGHTGRELRAGAATISLYALVSVGALIRIASALSLMDYSAGLSLSGLCWAGAFALFLVAYGPMLLRPRLSD